MRTDEIDYKKNGIIRATNEIGGIIEASYINNEKHGLWRHIEMFDGIVYVEFGLYLNNTKLENCITLDENLQEI